MKNTKLQATYQQTVLYEANRQFERFNELANVANILMTTCNEGEKLYPGFTNMVGDVWCAFYAVEPQLDPQKKEVNEIQYDMMKKIMKTDEFSRWQHLTANDELMSVLTAVSIAEQLKKWLQQNRETREAINKQERAERSEQRVYDQQKKLDEMRKQATTNLEQQRIEYQEAFINKQLEKVKEDQHQAKQALHQAMRRMSIQQFGEILEHSKSETKKTKKTVVEMGTLDDKKLEQVPISEQFQLAEQIKNHDTLKKIAELTGRFRRIAKKKQKTKHKMTMERKNIAMGQEVARLLPMELANFVMPNSKVDFLRRYAEHQTLLFDTKGKDRRGRGPIIICMDESSSMTSMKAESKAFCLALLMIARKQKRDFAIIPFASDVGEVRIFSKGRSSAQEILDFSNHFLGGGTNYEKPLRASLNILTKSEFNEADILFVTDGSSFLSSQFLDEFNTIKKKRKFECTTIVLTNLINTVDLKIVHRFSDKVIEVGELFEADEVFSL